MPDGEEADRPAWRYTSELAQEIELRWQNWWDENRTFEAANPAGTLADPDALAAPAWSELSPTEQRNLIDDHRLACVADAPVNWCPGLTRQEGFPGASGSGGRVVR